MEGEHQAVIGGARAAALLSRGVLSVGGPDARSFLQGLLTNDLTRLAPDRGIAAALLTPQGKLVAELLLAELPEGNVLIEADRALVPALLKRLTLYRLRAKVSLEDASEGIAVWALFGAEPLPGLDLPAPGAARRALGGLVLRDPRRKRLGARLYVPAETGEAMLEAEGYSPASAETYRAHRIALGVPEGVSELPPERLFALEANLAELNAVDFHKGCYVGQELTARMKHRAALKKRLVPVSGEPFPPAGTVLRLDGRDMGEIVSERGPPGPDRSPGQGFALLRIDRLAEEGFDFAHPLEADGAPITVHWPDWLPRPTTDTEAR